MSRARTVLPAASAGRPATAPDEPGRRRSRPGAALIIARPRGNASARDGFCGGPIPKEGRRRARWRTGLCITGGHRLILPSRLKCWAGSKRFPTTCLASRSACCLRCRGATSRCRKSTWTHVYTHQWEAAQNAEAGSKRCCGMSTTLVKPPNRQPLTDSCGLGLSNNWVLR